MPHPRYSDKEMARRARELYESEIRAQVEQDNMGKFLVIDVETGEYEMDTDEVVALDRATAKNPDAPFYLMRIGYPAAYRLGGRFTASRR